MNEATKSLIKGTQEALEYASGQNKKSHKKHQIKIPNDVDVKNIRLRLHMNRTEFCSRFGFSIRTIEKWEQGVRHPDCSARAYLLVIDHNPQAVEQALQAN